MCSAIVNRHGTVGWSGSAQTDSAVPVNGVIRYDRRSWCYGVDLRAALGQATDRQVDSIAGTIGDGRGIEIDRGRCKSRRVLAGADNVAEGEGVAARATGIGCGATVIECERRRAAGDGDRLAQVSVSVTVLPALRSPLEGDPHNRVDHRRRGIDLRAALGQATERRVDSIAGTVGDGRGIEIDCGRCESRRVLSGADNVAEGEGVAARAAGIGRGAAIIEGERRRAARNRHRLAQD